MPALFLDASALTKVYAQEVGTKWIQSQVNPRSGNEIYAAQITEVEVTSALVRHVPPLPAADLKKALGDLDTDFAADLEVLEVTPGILDLAAQLVLRHRLRAYDAVQLASALSLRDERGLAGLTAPTFVCADKSLNAAAQAEGLVVEDPNAHP